MKILKVIGEFIFYLFVLCIFMHIYVGGLGLISFGLFGQGEGHYDVYMSYGFLTMISIHLFGGLTIVFIEANSDSKQST